MCGRYAITLPPEAMEKLFRAIGALPNFPARYNAAPTQPLPIVRRDERGQRELVLARWGLIPSWSNGPDSRFSMINARAESVATNRAYRGAFRHRPCLVPADGFYEWAPAVGRSEPKQPYFFRMKSSVTFAFAGIWETWLGPGGDEIDSFAIIVTDANACVAPVHNRMPVILEPDDYALWLAEDDITPNERIALLNPNDGLELTRVKVSRRVNSPGNDDPSLIREITDSDESPSKPLLPF